MNLRYSLDFGTGVNPLIYSSGPITYLMISHCHSNGVIFSGEVAKPTRDSERKPMCHPTRGKLSALPDLWREGHA